MLEIGYALCTDGHEPNDVIRYVELAEQAGFDFAFLSEHDQPWVEQQGQSPFLWSIIGGIAQVTQRLRLVIGVICPTIHLHPAAIAGAVATVAAMMPGRCCLALQRGGWLSQQMWAKPEWTSTGHTEMLEEAVQVIRLLWQGGVRNHWGRHYSLENIQIYAPQQDPPAILLAAADPRSASLAGCVGDGLFSPHPGGELIRLFEQAGGLGKPRYGRVTVGWCQDDLTLHDSPPALPPTMSGTTNLMPYFLDALTRYHDARTAPGLCSTNPLHHLASIRSVAAAGYDHVYIHHVGPDQEALIRFYESSVLPELLSR
jgi:coenzyme F420-dependent glucose-6-phosphate dehydrogenase